jgi:hypothetical protein
MWRIGGRRKRAGRRRTIVTLAALVGGVALMFGALPVASASAGKAGQQFEFCPPDGAVGVRIQGINQNRQYSDYFGPVGPPGCHFFDGRHENVVWNWWWEGTVAVSYSYPWSHGQYLFYQICEVPKDQLGDTFGCFPDGRGNQ